MLEILFAQVSAAADLEVHVRVPGAEPVCAVLHDVAPGASKDFAFHGPRKLTYFVKARVQETTDEGAWRVGFEVTLKKGRHGEPVVVAAPVMQSRTNELAQFMIGGEAPVADSPDVYVFHGTTIDWIVSDRAQ